MDITLPNFHNARVLVFGDVMLDRYWQGSTSRISPEAPVPVVKIQDIENRAGGAGNVALGISVLGAKVDLIGLTGRSEEHTSELQSREKLVCRLLLEKKNLSDCSAASMMC